LQGIGVGGEWGGAVLIALESGSKSRRGLIASFPQAGVPLGLLLSTGAMALTERSLDPSQFLAWGWRLPFFASAALILVGFLIRSFVTESRQFAALKTQHKTSQTPVLDVVRHHWVAILLGAGCRLSENSVFYLFATYVLSYGADVGIPRSITLASVNLAAALACFTIPFFGIASDWTSRKAIYTLGNLLLMLLALPYYALLSSGQTAWVMAATIVMLGVVHAMLYAVQGALISELFPTGLRYSGASLAYQLAGPVAGGLAPIVATTLAHRFANPSGPLAGYVILLAAISMACAWQLNDGKYRDVTDDQAA
jgi:MFS family permease